MSGGEIVRDPQTGAPTGMLKDRAMELVEAVMPPLTAEEEDRCLYAFVSVRVCVCCM